MILKTKLIESWPKLTWVAKLEVGSEELFVLHGPKVEIQPKWIVEGVWAEDYSKGNFDQTDLIFGSGIRVRQDKAVFVSSGSVFDRILYCEKNQIWYFSNSLPALLALTGLHLRTDYLSYSKDVRSITKGLKERNENIVTDGETIVSVFYNNLIFDGQSVLETDKPDTAPDFDCYNDYKDFIEYSSKQLGNNASSSSRKHQIKMLSSISSGYDSSVAAVISRYAGCEDTVTIKDSSSFWRGSDSGKEIATVLGMTCKEYPLSSDSYPLEEAIWAAEGRPGIMNWTQFEYLEPLCLFFTGCHGEKLWDRVNHDHPDPFVRRDTSSLGFCEFRLFKGVFQCPLPFWGVRHSKELRKITESKEMEPWYMNKDYDKPIARRIVEEAGVERNKFGMLNKNTSLEKTFWWPLSEASKKSFAEYLLKENVFSPSIPLVKFLGIISYVDALIYKNTFKKLSIPKGSRPWQKITANHLIFQWANHALREKYKIGLYQELNMECSNS
ncbi:hypothetical protein [Desulfobacter latus]|uniref:Asparagine synthetase domain-containing protein n=1 Tax=Desulfobacter latus TaxID=2292 RepID=A0A850T6N1_9BACT|nr:hypothetical protein [Desulfobacter latus]NWH05032.1 hypothetical protein [Desulfobacter latus]